MPEFARTVGIALLFASCPCVQGRLIAVSLQQFGIRKRSVQRLTAPWKGKKKDLTPSLGAAKTAFPRGAWQREGR
jgi:hypothetical protein